MSSGNPTPIFDTSQAAFEIIAGGLSSLLQELCTLNDSKRDQHAADLGENQTNASPEGSVYGCDPLLASKFHSVSKPNISVLDYLVRLRKYSPCSNCCFVAALVYIDRAHRAVGLVVDSFSVHRLLATTVLLATKFYDDRILQNKNHAKIVGLSVSELADLEIEFLKAIDFDLNISMEQYCSFEHTVMMRQAKLKFLATSTATSPANVSPSPSSFLSSYGSRTRSVSSEKRQPSPVRPSHSDYERPLSGSFVESSPISKNSGTSISSISSTSSTLSSVPSDLLLSDSKAFIPHRPTLLPTSSIHSDFSDEEAEVPWPRRLPTTADPAMAFASARSILDLDSSYLPPPPRRRGSMLRDPSYTSSLQTIPDVYAEYRHTDSELRAADEPLSAPRSAGFPRISRVASHSQYDSR